MTRSVAYRNQVLDKALRAVNFTNQYSYLSLHTGYPGTTGASEVTNSGGSAYARQSVTFGAASSGTSTNSGAINFTTMPAISTPGVVGFGLWDASTSGNFAYGGWLTNASEGPRVYALDDTVANTLKAPAHGFSAGDVVAIITEVANSTTPSGLTANTLYFVINPTTNTFQVSATSGGSAVATSGAGMGLIQRVISKVVNLGDTFTINSGQLTLTEY